jgi:hypothetical protein
VIQVPVARKNHAQSIWALVAMQLEADAPAQSAPATGRSNDTMEGFLQHSGALFGKDPQNWQLQGKPNVEYHEQNLVRYVPLAVHVD